MKPRDRHAPAWREHNVATDNSRHAGAWRSRLIRFLLLLATNLCPTFSSEIQLPPRPTNAPSGSELVAQIRDLDLLHREARLRDEILRGNVPDFWRKFVPIKTGPIEYLVAPDYLAVGSDTNYFLTPLSPNTAQLLADKLDCLLPTPKMVDEIYAAAALKLTPTPIPPSPAMTTVRVFAQHNELVRQNEHPLTAGHKKDVVITRRLTESPGKVAIYGWHKTNNEPIQLLYLGHTDKWVDYSHGVRLVARIAKVDGQETRLETILADPTLSTNLSNEGTLPLTRYTNLFRERISEFRIDPGVRVVINSPDSLQTNQPIRLILYALPNGNTIEQTLGHKMNPGDDWHFDIQHIGAQTRWLREQTSEIQIVVAYLECAEKAWPAWRRQNDPDNTRIPAIVQNLRERFPPSRDLRLVLTGHSGGGSFTFGYINGLPEIPNDIERIAFLDSNYAYDSKLPHAAKLTRWLAASDRHFLCVLAYNDAIALLDGKSFVSESGGTWGRSHAMIDDLDPHLHFQRQTDPDWQRLRALDGRVQFILKENPARAILHTRQVELNGFLHSMVTGTPLENHAYTYFAPRAYEAFIAP